MMHSWNVEGTCNVSMICVSFHVPSGFAQPPRLGGSPKVNTVKTGVATNSHKVEDPSDPMGAKYDDTYSTERRQNSERIST